MAPFFPFTTPFWVLLPHAPLVYDILLISVASGVFTPELGN